MNEELEKMQQQAEVGGDHIELLEKGSTVWNP
jgi:hypothetical protein